MKFWVKTGILIGCSAFTIGLCPGVIKAETAPVPAKAKVEKTQVKSYLTVSPMELVYNPSNFLNKDIKMFASFHKFSTLGLDYDKAMKSSKDYISILIKRPDVPEKYTIPLSEMKLIIKRDQAEKFIDMESGDKVEITGKVFSSALNDPWIEVDKLTSLELKKADNSKKKTDKN